MRRHLVALLMLAAALAPVLLVAQDAPPDEPLAAFRELAARVGPSVVRVEVAGGRVRGDLPRRHLFRPVAERDGGSGVVVGRDLVVTHGALADAVGSSFTLLTCRGQRVEASLLALDAAREVAVLRSAAPLDVPAVELAADARPRTGELVLALGDPFGTARDAAATVTLGAVEGRARLDAPEVTWTGEVLLTSAAVNPGSEGGALVDLEGRVVGLLAPLAKDQRSDGLLGHALPADVVRAALAAALEQPHGPRLGLSGRAVGRGVRVEQVAPGSAAARAGLREGDVIVLAGDTPVATTDDLRRGLAAGGPVRLVLERGGARVTVTVEVPR